MSAARTPPHLRLPRRAKITVGDLIAVLRALPSTAIILARDVENGESKPHLWECEENGKTYYFIGGE